MFDEGFIGVERTVAAVVITLRRPAARNALDIAMVRAIHAALRDATTDPSVHRIILRSSLAGTFCAGGDILLVREEVIAGRVEQATRFFDEEFALNHAIATMSKPVVALVDGICFGGGCGLALHASHPVVSENAVLAMPEVRIGYVPDVGSSYFLSRLPPGVGACLAVTGARVEPGDAVALGLVPNFVRSDRIDDLFEALATDTSDTDQILQRYRTEVAPGEIWAHLSSLKDVFGSGDLEGYRRKIGQSPDPWISAMKSKFNEVSPNSQREAVGLLLAATGHSLADCLGRELVVARRVVQHPDFAEGVRAALVDKDQRPKWAEASLAVPS